MLRRAPLTLLFAMALPGALLAQPAVVVLHPVATQEGGTYKEISGTWADSAPRNTAVTGMSTAPARVLVAGEKLEGKAEYTFLAVAAGEYQVQLAWPQQSNAKAVSVTVKGAVFNDERAIDFGDIPAIAVAEPWITLGTVSVPAGGEVGITIDADKSTGAWKDSAPWQLVVDAARLVPAVITPVPDSPFVTPDQPVDVTSPFEASSSATQITPEATPAPARTPEAVDPFAEPGETTLADPSTNPFAAQAASSQADPFEVTTTAPSNVADPFAAPTSSSPFPTSTTDAQADPFAAPSTTTAADPFASAPPSQPAINDPFASAATTQAADPFGAPTSNTQASDPFAATNAGTSITQPVTTSIAPAVTPIVTPVPTPNPVNISFANVPVEIDEPTVEIPYLATIAEARKLASSGKRNILVLFSGESTPARTFEQTLSRESVAKNLENFVVVRLDYRKNRDLARQFAVRDYPYLVILNRQGYTVGHMVPTNNAEKLVDSLKLFYPQP